MKKWICWLLLVLMLAQLMPMAFAEEAEAVEEEPVFAEDEIEELTLDLNFALEETAEVEADPEPETRGYHNKMIATEDQVVLNINDPVYWKTVTFTYTGTLPANYLIRTHENPYVVQCSKKFINAYQFEVTFVAVGLGYDPVKVELINSATNEVLGSATIDVYVLDKPIDIYVKPSVLYLDLLKAPKKTFELHVIGSPAGVASITTSGANSKLVKLSWDYSPAGNQGTCIAIGTITGLKKGKLTININVSSGGVLDSTTLTVIITDNGGFTDISSSDYYYPAVAWAIQNGIAEGTSSKTFSPNAACTRAQIMTFLWRAKGSPKVSISNPFKDVKKTDYFYKAVLWAASKGITYGTDGTHFSPNAKCTRAQSLTFLWRAKGSLSGSGSNPFTDVSTSDYFYNAVLWAVSNKITTGKTATEFAPDDPCTRAEILTFLWRAKGSLSGSGSNPFTDVSTSDYFYNAVLWAVSKKITTGKTATEFAPEDPCTRAEILTFLYRAFGK